MNEACIKRDVIVIGTSAGGVEALLDLCRDLSPEIPAVMGVVIHRSPWSRTDVAAIYGHRTRIRVREARHGEALQQGTVFFAPADRHLKFNKAGMMETSRGAKIHFTRPAVDELFTSAAASFGHRVVGVLLTGNGSDGGHGLVMIKQYGGITLIQKPGEASHPSMPLTGLREDTPDLVTLDELPSLLFALALGQRVSTHAPEPLAS